MREIRPTKIRLEASSHCQLRCRSCPTGGNAATTAVGRGFLRADDFCRILDKHPWITEVELSNYGEIFLNPELLAIIRGGYERKVILKADNGVNLNSVTDAVLEGLVRYRFRSITCSIDGASNETYRMYRVNGNFDKVIENLRKLNLYKASLGSPYPLLKWQFVVFGHNEHEIEAAKKLAEELGMTFALKLPWDPSLSPPKQQEYLRKEIGASSRDGYKLRFGLDYMSGICRELWESPQINWDGRVLGCSRNFWRDFGANAFEEGLPVSINSERMRYARLMLLGKKPPREDIPCSTCDIYRDMKTEGRWLQTKDSFSMRSTIRSLYHSVGMPLARCKLNKHEPTGRAGNKVELASTTHPLQLPLPLPEAEGWKPYPIFSGSASRALSLSCHVSALRQYYCPHPPHAHKEEEILLLLVGEAELTIPSLSPGKAGQRKRLKAGEFVYYPAQFAHTLETVSREPANYLMLKWHIDGDSTRTGVKPLEFGQFSAAIHVFTDTEKNSSDGFRPRLLFEGPTSYLGKLHCHVSTLAPGAGYGAHADPYDVALVVLEGEVQTLGRTVKPYGVVFYRSGELHDMNNPGETTARYLVFELHAPQRALAKKKA